MILVLSMLGLVLCSCAKTKVEPKETRGDLPTVTPTNAKAAGDLLKDFVAIEVEGKDADDKFKKPVDTIAQDVIVLYPSLMKRPRPKE